MVPSLLQSTLASAFRIQGLLLMGYVTAPSPNSPGVGIIPISQMKTVELREPAGLAQFSILKYQLSQRHVRCPLPPLLVVVIRSGRKNSRGLLRDSATMRVHFLRGRRINTNLGKQGMHPVQNVKRGPWAWWGPLLRMWEVTAWLFLAPVPTAGEAE